MPKQSAGILLFRLKNLLPEVMLVHPGGPFWHKKDNGSWSIPKGEFESEKPLEAAIREFKEETGFDIDGNFIELKPTKQKSGKTIYAWALEFEIDPDKIVSNKFVIEWPYKSGQKKSFPEINKAAWFSINEAYEKIISGQRDFLNQLEATLNKPYL